MVSFTCLMEGVCCTRYWVPLTHLDLLRLVVRGGFKPSEICELISAQLYKCALPSIEVEGGEYYLALKRKGLACIFLESDGKCAVHEFKPIVCRFYPFTYKLRNGRIEISLYDRAIDECPGLLLDGRPIDWRIVERLTALARVRVIEVKLYREIVGVWNERVNAPGVGKLDFLDFALKEANRHRRAMVREGLWVD